VDRFLFLKVQISGSGIAVDSEIRTMCFRPDAETAGMLFSVSKAVPHRSQKNLMSMDSAGSERLSGQ
jgi:hypothetical protein